MFADKIIKHHFFMKDLLHVLDELASVTDKYTTLKEVLENYYGKNIEKPYISEDYDRLKQLLYRNKRILEYKNAKDATDGFRYKSGFEHFFAQRKEDKSLRKKKGDERRLFLTGGLQMLLDGEIASETLIDLECVTELHNLELVKTLSKFLGKVCVSYTYLQGFEKQQKITMHPHLLKEYNSRWFLFGYVQHENDNYEIVCFSLDRITSKNIIPHLDIPFKKAPRNFYNLYFKDIVGVTKPEGGIVETITIRTKDFTVHNLIRTKPIHTSQKETVPFDKDNLVGEFTIQVIPNIELQTRLLSYGPGLYVTSGGKVQQDMSNAINKMKALYDSV